jgi:mitochondrial fission protein ELM1
MTKTPPLALPTGTTAWIVTNGMAGFEAQALGITEALGLKAELKRVRPGAPWKWLAPFGPAAPDSAIHAPWPDLLIASGRQSIPYARMIANRSPATFTAVLQDPRVNPAQFDFVWTPAHDQLTGANVLSTLTSPHRLTPEMLTREAARIAPQIAHLPQPRIAVLLGGANAVYDFSEDDAQKIADDLAFVAQEGAGLMITPSRRTSEKQLDIIRDRLKNLPALIWDGAGDNPYFGFLGAADAIIATCDSVNMLGEAASTGKPLHVFELRGGSPKFRRFLDGIYACGAARLFALPLERWDYEPLNATQQVAQAIARAYVAKRGET